MEHEGIKVATCPFGFHNFGETDYLSCSISSIEPCNLQSHKNGTRVQSGYTINILLECPNVHESKWPHHCRHVMVPNMGETKWLHTPCCLRFPNAEESKWPYNPWLLKIPNLRNACGYMTPTTTQSPHLATSTKTIIVQASRHTPTWVSLRAVRRRAVVSLSWYHSHTPSPRFLSLPVYLPGLPDEHPVCLCVYFSFCVASLHPSPHPSLHRSVQCT